MVTAFAAAACADSKDPMDSSDYESTEQGVVTTFVYDALDRLVSVISP